MTKETPWWAIEEDPEKAPHVRVYHTRISLQEDYGQQGGLSNTVAGIDVAGRWFDLCPVGQMVLQIPGVTGIEVRKNQITVCKSPIFKWDEIDEHMMPLMYGIKQAVAVPVFTIAQLEREATAR
jgi:hypothetical protein